jgi:L-ascorbate peroxidase
VLRFKTEL